MYYKKLKINGTEYPLAVNLTGVGAPPGSLEAEIGMFYMDEAESVVYKFTSNGWESIDAALYAELEELRVIINTVEESINGVEEELAMLNEGGIE